MLRELRPLVAIRGNHDKVCSGLEDGELFNRIALEAAHVDAQEAHPVEPRVAEGAAAGPGGGGRPRSPSATARPIDEDAYIFGELEALNVFRHTDFPLCFFGHSHFPVIFALSPDAITTVLTVAPSFRFKLQAGRALPDQPRLGRASRATGTRCASFAIYDSDSRVVTIHRLPYQLKQAQQKILDAGLPRPLADRLAHRPLGRRQGEQRQPGLAQQAPARSRTGQARHVRGRARDRARRRARRGRPRGRRPPCRAARRWRRTRRSRPRSAART